MDGLERSHCKMAKTKGKKAAFEYDKKIASLRYVYWSSWPFF